MSLYEFGVVKETSNRFLLHYTFIIVSIMKSFGFGFTGWSTYHHDTVHSMPGKFLLCPEDLTDVNSKGFNSSLGHSVLQRSGKEGGS